MPIDTAIDVTPNFTASTLQFDTEILNVVLTSMLAVLILANINSIVTKLVYFTRNTTFHYESWLRAFIFANSDDPVRLFTWSIGRYIYRSSEKQPRKPQTSRLGRAIVPLSARLLVLIFSFASIAITIPSEKNLTACDANDFSIRIDKQNSQRGIIPTTVCVNIPMESRRGTVRSTASYCECPSGGTIPFAQSFVHVENEPMLGRTRITIGSNGVAEGRLAYIEWRQADAQFTTFRTNMASSLKLRDIADVVMISLLSRSGCEEIGVIAGNNNTNSLVLVIDCGSTLNPSQQIDDVMSHFRSSLTLFPTPNRQARVRLTNNGGQTITKECPIKVTIVRPIVNILPLAITLVLFLAANVFVSISVNRHGNALDAGYHIIKEILGHDTTSNPLEEPRERNEIMEVELRKWICTGGCGHVGFIGRHGDIPVESFAPDLVVAECTQAARELGISKAITVAGSEPSSSIGFRTPWTPNPTQATATNIHYGDYSPQITVPGRRENNV